MRMRRLAPMLCLAGLIFSTTGALAAPAQVLAAVNLRTGPGAQYFPIMVLPPGAPVEIYGCLNDNSWCDVGYGDMRGWLSSRYLGSTRGWTPERQIMRPPVVTPPPIYREPPVYANPPPVYRAPDWDEPYPAEVYIEPPPVYVYRPPVGVGPPMPDLPQPDVEVYREQPRLRAAPPASTAPTAPPMVVSTPPPTTRAAPTTPSIITNRPTATAPAAQPAAPSPTPSEPTFATTAQPSAPATTSPTTQPTTAKPTYGGAVGKPGAPCKWVNGVCRND